MKSSPFYADTTESGVVLKVWLQPKSSRNEIKGLHGDTLRVSVTSPPIEGRANKALCDLMAKEFGVSKSQIEIIKGHKSRTKIIKIDGVTPDYMIQRIEKGSE
ncbi:MAG: DUF167 domain-containing protein [Thermodesulfobacteriota bacterium]|nr:DUF167 domain-containing protein [Thermodesulfobacteriota bacterium]